MTTCLVTQRYYIGIHSTNNLYDGYMGSGKRLRYSMRKHGVDNHVKEILKYFATRELLVEEEIKIVTFDLIKEPNCMNLVLGGGGFMLDDYHYKCSKAGGNVHAERMKNDLEYSKKYKDISSEIFKAYHKKGTHNYKTFEGKQHSDESKKLISDKAKERIGDKNSQYDTCWITKDGVNKKIKKDELDKYQLEGWVKGRK